MTKSALLTALRENHQAFLNTFLTISEAQFLACPPDKWTAGQHLEHILRAVNPLALAVRLPKFVLKMMFGKSNRPSKTYEGLVEKYQSHSKMEARLWADTFRIKYLTSKNKV